MTNKEKIAKIIYDYMGYIYCNNCRNYGNEELCEWCNRKSMGWKISEECAEKMADAIIEVIEDEANDM